MKLSGCPVYSQRDERWKKKKLGFSDLLIDGYGCAVACMAMLACYYGKDTDPGKLNDDLKSKDGFSGAYIIWQAINKVYNDIKFTSWKDYPLDPAPVDNITDQLKNGKPVIVWVDINPTQPGNQMHFVILVGVEGDDYWVNDPWFGDQILFSKRYGVPKVGILGHRFFSGPVPEQLGEEKKYTEAEMAQMRHERDNNHNLYKDEREKNEGLEKQVQHYKQFIEEIASQLNCGGDIGEIKRVAEELLSKASRVETTEGKNAQLQNLVDQKESEIDNLTEELAKAEKQYGDTAQELSACSTSSHALLEAKQKVENELSKAKKEIERLEKVQPVGKLTISKLVKEIFNKIFGK